MRDYTKKSEAAYDKKANKYTQTFDSKVTEYLKKRAIEKLAFENGDKVLDVACGIGDLLKRLKEKSLIDIYGVDISSKMVEESRKNLNGNNNIKVGNVESIPFDNEMFDSVITTAAFHHFQNPIEAIKDIKRVLKPGGRIIIYDFTLPIVVRQMVNPFIKLSPEGDVKFYSLKEIKEMFTNEGFESIEASKLSSFAYEVIGYKNNIK